LQSKCKTMFHITMQTNNKQVQGLHETHKGKIHSFSILMCTMWVPIVLHVCTSIVKINQITNTSIAWWKIKLWPFFMFDVLVDALSWPSYLWPMPKSALHLRSYVDIVVTRKQSSQKTNVTNFIRTPWDFFQFWEHIQHIVKLNDFSNSPCKIMCIDWFIYNLNIKF
jgi:hypothetical protein